MNHAPYSIRAAVYARVATEAQLGQDDRLDQQADACHRLAGEIGVDVVAEYRDDGFAGTTLERPGLQAVLDAARQHEVDVIVCERPDRLARGATTLSGVESELARLGVTIQYAADDSRVRRTLTDSLATPDSLRPAARKAR